jgi:hypothetical protein
MVRAGVEACGVSRRDKLNADDLDFTRQCEWCGEEYISVHDETYCCEECKHEAEWDEKVANQWGAL